jgi:hypothetical protein
MGEGLKTAPAEQGGEEAAARLPAAARVDDLVARLSPTGLVGQMLQNGIDYYGAGIQLPRYIVSQECLAGFDGGDIYIAPPVPHTPSSGFPQPVNMGNTWDRELVRELRVAVGVGMPVAVVVALAVAVVLINS